MAVIYLSSVDGSDVDDGSTWALAKATLAAALTAAGAGGTVYMDNAHAETQASAMTLTSPGTAASPTSVICSDRSTGAPPTAVATTGTVTTTGTTMISFGAGHSFFEGITFAGGTGTGNTTGIKIFAVNLASSSAYFKNCGFSLPGTHVGAALSIGSSGTTGTDSNVEFDNCTVTFAATTQKIFISKRFVWRKGTIAGATTPTTLFDTASVAGQADVTVLGVDFNGLGASKNLVNGAFAAPSYFYFADCKLPSSLTIVTGSIVGTGGVEVNLVNCDSADPTTAGQRYHKQPYQGTITSETTIVRSGGATDGIIPASRKMVTTANSKFYSPLISDWMPLWNTATGSAITVAIPVVTDNVTLKDNEAWIEVEGLGTSGFPLGTFASDSAPDVLNAGTDQTTDATSSWTTTGLATPVKQILSTTFTPQEIGFVRVRVCLAKPSTTMYFDPAPINESWVKYGANAYMVGADGIVQVAAGGGAPYHGAMAGGLLQ